MVSPRAKDILAAPPGICFAYGMLCGRLATLTLSVPVTKRTAEGGINGGKFNESELI